MISENCSQVLLSFCVKSNNGALCLWSPSLLEEPEGKEESKEKEGGQHLILFFSCHISHMY
jgi:hypothetical protein